MSVLRSSRLPAWAPPALVGLLPLLLAIGVPGPVAAQYFGRNKVQYDRFDFRVLSTPHFRIHYYPEEALAVEDAARMAERWYERFARTFQHEFEKPKPIILYADHPDFQQTNTLQGFLGESTGGVTESLKNRVIMPLTGSYQDTDHVLGHELVHAFQYNIAQSRQGSGIPGLARLPGWLVEGMAEYLSVGREDPLTAMWLRDAARRDDLPTIEQMIREVRYFPYRVGQALWAFIGGEWGDEAVVDLFRRSLRLGWNPALEQVLGIDSDTLSARWAEAVKAEYLPLMEDRTPPSELGTLLLAPSTGAGRQNLAPSVSPDGRLVAFLSEKDLFSIDLYLADARTGRIVRTLSSAASDPHWDALRFLDSSGTWSPDGTRLAFVVFAEGDNQIVVVDTRSGEVLDRITPEGVTSLVSPAWSPDGRTIAFSGLRGGISDLYLYDLETGEVRQLTDDRYADYQPAWSPAGRTMAFSPDRGPGTDFDLLTFDRFQLALLDVATGEVRCLPVFGDVKHINPQFSPDGEELYFISDQDGFSDVYSLELRTGRVRRITRVATAVSGVTWTSPALSVARETGQLVFSVFDEFEFHVRALDPAEVETEAVEVAQVEAAPGRFLPPARPRYPSRVAAYLDDPRTGLTEPGTFATEDAADYESRLQLDFIGQPTIGIGTDNFGNYIGGGASAFFSDMLGDRVLGVALQAQGTFKDIGGQLFYLNQRRRWNWGYAAGRIPFQRLFFSFGVDPELGTQTVSQIRQRIYLTSATGLVAYPFSTTRRIEATAGFIRWSFDVEQDELVYDQFGRLIARRRTQLPELEPDPLNLFQASIALVGDNSYAAFTSPIRGRRYRIELESTRGTANYQTVIVDYRRYFSPSLDFTFAVRGLHYGRYAYGNALRESRVLQPLFLGWETFIRGYAYESFESRECVGGTEGSCPALDRMFGHRLAVANFEVRVPFIGTEQFGLIDLPYVPMELVAFADVGLAWDDDRKPILAFRRTETERVPLLSTGVSARFNILGIMIFEAYYAYPWQRPIKGWHWGFQLGPGW